MQNVTATYARLAASARKNYETKLVIDGVGTFYEEDSLRSVKTSISLFKDSPKIGTAVSQEITVVMALPIETIPRMGCLRPYIRATGTAAKSSAVTITDGGVLSSEYATYASERITFSQDSGATVTGETLIFPIDSSESLTSEWIPQGVFFIDTREITANVDGVPTITLHGFDAMLKAEQEYASNDIVGDAPDTSVVQAIADKIGVEVDARTWDIMRGYIIPFPVGYTMREILGYIAASYAGFFVINELGKLMLVSLLGLPVKNIHALLGDENGDAILFGGVGIIV